MAGASAVAIGSSILGSGGGGGGSSLDLTSTTQSRSGDINSAMNSAFNVGSGSSGKFDFNSAIPWVVIAVVGIVFLKGK